MSNSLGFNRVSTPLDAVRVLQPKMFMETETIRKQKKKTETIVKIISPNEISVPINTKLFTIAHILLAACYITFSVLVFIYGNLNLTADLYIEKNTLNLAYMINNATRDTILSSTTIDGIINELISSQSVAFPITWLVGIISALCGVFNLLSISIFRKYYFYYLTKCKSPLRWVEYFITSGMIMAVISFTVGIDTLFLLTTLSVLVASGTSFGYWTETLARPLNQEKWTLPMKTRMVPWGLGAVPLTIAMVHMLINFYTSEASSKSNNTHVYAIIWSHFFLFPSFGNILAIQQFSKPKQYQRIEIMYQVSAFITRTVLGGLLFAFVLRNNTWETQFMD